MRGPSSTPQALAAGLLSVMFLYCSHRKFGVRSMRKRWDAASRYVVFHDILVPLAHGVTTEEAFALIVEENGCEPVWTEDALGVTLRLRVRENDDVLHDSYARSHRRGNSETQRSFIMSSICNRGVRGWRALPRDEYSLQQGVALRTIYTVWDWPDRIRRG